MLKMTCSISKSEKKKKKQNDNNIMYNIITNIYIYIHIHIKPIEHIEQYNDTTHAKSEKDSRK